MPSDTGSQKVPEHPHRPSGTHELGGPVERGLGAGRVEHDVVVGTRRHRGAPVARPPPDGAGRWASTSTSAPRCRGGGHGAEPDGSGAEHEDPHPVGHAGPVEPVQGDAERLDQVGVLRRQAGGQRHGARRMDPHLVGQAPVEADAVHGAEGGSALGVLAGQAPVARPAVHDRQHGDRACRRRVGPRTRGRGSPRTVPWPPCGGPSRRSPSSTTVTRTSPGVGSRGGADQADPVGGHLDAAHRHRPRSFGGKEWSVVVTGSSVGRSAAVGPDRFRPGAGARCPGRAGR